MIHFVVQQKVIQHCKANIFQFKNVKKKKKKGHKKRAIAKDGGTGTA